MKLKLINNRSVIEAPGALEGRVDIQRLTFECLVKEAHVLVESNISKLLNLVLDIKMVSCFKKQRELRTDDPVQNRTH